MSATQNTNDLIEFIDRSADQIDKSAGSVVQIVQNSTISDVPSASLIAAAVAKINTASIVARQPPAAAAAVNPINKSESGSCESPDLITSVTTAAPPAAPAMKNLTQVCMEKCVARQTCGLATVNLLFRVRIGFY